MNGRKYYRLLSIFCWLCTAVVAILEGFLLHMTHSIPGVEIIGRYARLVPILLVIWLCASVWFTVQARKDREK